MSGRIQKVSVHLDWHGVTCVGWAELALGARGTLESPADPPEILELVLYDAQGVEVPTGPDDWERDDLYDSVIQSASTY